MNRPEVIITIVVLCIVLLLVVGIYAFINGGNGYCVMESYGNIKIVTTNNEARIDDIDGNILVHNVLNCVKSGNLIYIVDTNNDKILVNVFTKEITSFIDHEARITDLQEMIFDSLYWSSDYNYIYE